MALNTVSSDRLSTNVKASNLNSGFGQLGNRNLIINGAMQVAQRDTQVTGNTSSGYTTVDRFQLAIAAAGTWTTDQSSVTDLAGFSKAFKVTCTTANGDANNLSNAAGVQACQYRFEGQDLQGFHKGFSSAKQYALSFYVKSNKTGTYNVELLDNDNSRHICKSYTISSASTWEKKTLILDADTTGKFDNDTNLSLQLRWYLSVGTNFTSGTLATSWASNTSANKAVGNVNLAQATSNFWEITGVQLEVGSVATDFEHRSFGQELALCQRYYSTSYTYGTAAGTATFDGSVRGESLRADRIDISPQFKMTMRAVPTVTIYSPNSGSSGNVYFDHSVNADRTAVASQIGTSGFSSCFRSAADLAHNGDQHASCHYAASAEL